MGAFGKKRVERTWRDVLTCDCITWVAIFMLLVWVPIIIAAALAREIKAEDTGVLVSASSGLPMATATRVSHSSFADMQTMPEDSLRNIRHCTFVHRGAFHRFQVAALARKQEGELHIVAPDRSTLTITGWLNDDVANTSSRMLFSRP